MTEIQTPRDEVFARIQVAIAGHRIEDALPAFVDAFAGLAGYTADSPDEADMLIDALMPEVKRAIRENWDEIERARGCGGASLSRA